MKEVYTIGDIVKINIKGTITNCLVLSDFLSTYSLSHNENYTDTIPGRPKDSFEVLKWDPEFPDDEEEDDEIKLVLLDCYQILIGDQKVWVEDYEICEYS